MRYTVEGLDRRTGRNAVVDVDAACLRDAEDQALAIGVLPSKVFPSRAAVVGAGAVAANDAAGADGGRPKRTPRAVAMALLTATPVLVALVVAGWWAARWHKQAERKRELGQQRNTQMFIDYERSRARLQPIVVPLIQAKTQAHARQAAADESAEAEHTEHAEGEQAESTDEPLD